MELLSEYNEWCLKRDEVKWQEADKRILFSIVNDLEGRAGIGDEWYQIDDDIKEEILNEWLAIIKGR